MPCSNTTKTQNPLKFVRVPQTPEPISAVSWPKFTILSEHVETVLLLNKFFPIVDTCLSCEDMARQSCAMVSRWRFFLHPVFAASRLQRISDLHSKFALRPHHVPKYGKHPISRLLRLGEEKKRKKKKEEEERRKKQDENIMVCPIT